MKTPTLKIKISNNTECHICEEKINKIHDKILYGENVMIFITSDNGEKHIHLVAQGNMKALIQKYGLPFHT